MMQTRATPKPGQASPVITEDTARVMNYNLETLLTKLKLIDEEEVYFMRSLSDQNMSFDFDRTMKQFTVYNPTGRGVFLSIFDVDSTHYMFNVATLKYFVSPPFLFLGLKVAQTTFVAGSVNPILTVHNKTLLSPGSFVIP